MHCPYCHNANDAHTPTSEAQKPYAGAASLCAYCCRFGIFDEKLNIRKPTDEEAAELEGDEAAQKALRFAQHLVFLAATKQ